MVIKISKDKIGRFKLKWLGRFCICEKNFKLTCRWDEKQKHSADAKQSTGKAPFAVHLATILMVLWTK